MQIIRSIELQDFVCERTGEKYYGMTVRLANLTKFCEGETVDFITHRFNLLKQSAEEINAILKKEIGTGSIRTSLNEVRNLTINSQESSNE